MEADVDIGLVLEEPDGLGVPGAGDDDFDGAGDAVEDGFQASFIDGLGGTQVVGADEEADLVLGEEEGGGEENHRPKIRLARKGLSDKMLYGAGA